MFQRWLPDCTPAPAGGAIAELPRAAAEPDAEGTGGCSCALARRPGIDEKGTGEPERWPQLGSGLASRSRACGDIMDLPGGLPGSTPLVLRKTPGEGTEGEPALEGSDKPAAWPRSGCNSADEASRQSWRLGGCPLACDHCSVVGGGRPRLAGTCSETCRRTLLDAEEPPLTRPGSRLGRGSGGERLRVPGLWPWHCGERCAAAET